MHSVPSEEDAGVSPTQHVNLDAKTSFCVYWNSELAVDNILETCGLAGSPCKQIADGFCLCNVPRISDPHSFR